MVVCGVVGCGGLFYYWGVGCGNGMKWNWMMLRSGILCPVLYVEVNDKNKL